MLVDSQCTNALSHTAFGTVGNGPEPHGLYANVQPSRGDESRQHSGQARASSLRNDGASSNVARCGRVPQRSILCVNDDQTIAIHLADGLTELGYGVEMAPDGEIGLEKIFTNRPDLVLCDCWMPRMSGLDLLQRLSAAGPEYAALPFVLLTADRNNELAGRRLGADDCLTKPVDLELLGVVIENRLRRFDRRAASATQVCLPPRERDVLTWVGRGKTSAEIAIILGLSERTVNFHCEQVTRRLDAVNRTQAVAKALVEKLIAV
jgi:DNA-binding NarL/FixJ family response regulator